MNWVMYGTSNVAKIPHDKLLIETLVLSHGEGNDHFKSIVRPERVHRICSPHWATYKEGMMHCTSINTDAISPFVHIDTIRINHYWTRDEYYLNTFKIPRRLKWGTSAEICQRWSQMYSVHYDSSIFRFIEPLRKKIFPSLVDKTNKSKKKKKG